MQGAPSVAEDRSALVCRTFVEIVSDYLEGALPAPERWRVEAHRRACPSCRRYLEQIRSVIGALRLLRDAASAGAAAPPHRRGGAERPRPRPPA